jgi:glycosyltransferase involved in cell wall biosynthesis
MNVLKIKHNAPTVRVLMVVPQYPYPIVGGLERQSHELSKALIELGVEVQVLSGKTQEDQSKVEYVEGVLVHRLLWPKNKWLRFIRSPFDILRLLFKERHSYDVIHLHQYSWFGLFVIMAARLIRKPILTKLPNDGVYGLPGVAKSRLGWIKIAIFKLTNAVVAMTKASLTELNDIGFPLKQVLFTPNGIKLVEDDTPAAQQETNLELCKIVCVGTLREQKGLVDLLYAWKKLVYNTNQAIQLELWGDGPLEFELKALCTELSITESVIFRGYVELVRQKLKDMDIFVLASLGEGNSNAILEAMAASLPIASTRVGGASIQVGPIGDRFLVEVGDQHGLYNCLKELVENTKLRRDLGAAMHERILSHFEIHRVAESYITAYSHLARGEFDLIGRINSNYYSELN